MRSVALLWLIFACACGGAQETGESDASGSDIADSSDASGDTSPDAAPDAVDLPCPTGHVLGADGECMAVGIQGCIEMFINPETGLCEPTPEHCPPGQIPIFSGDDQGCRVVGIPDCDEMFINPDTGLCDPTPEHCPLGSIPIFSGDDQGCHPVGIPDCHPDFIDAETGLCDPDPDFCEAGYIAVPTQGCVSLDPSGGCGEGTWGNVEELAGDVHVDLGYAGGDSDGSREKPWALIAYALGNTLSGGRMVLAAGNYDEGVLLAKSISLAGRCSSMVTISGTRDSVLGPAVVEVKGDVDVGITDVTVSGPGVGLVVHSGARLVLERAAIIESRGFGMIVGHLGTTAVATDLLVARIDPWDDGTMGRGISVEQGAALTLTRAMVVDSHGGGLFALDYGTTASIEHVLVARMQPHADGTGGGGGIHVQLGATLTLESACLMDNQGIGLASVGSGSQVTASGVVIARTQPSTDGKKGHGIKAAVGAALTVEGSSLIENHGSGLYVADAGSTVSAVGILIARTQPWANGERGRGIAVQFGAQLTLENSSLVENHEVGFMAADPESLAVLTGVAITRTVPNGHGTLGRGIQIQNGAALTLTRSTVVENHGVGLMAVHPVTKVTAEHLLVARTQPSADGNQAAGIGLRTGASLDLTHSCITDNPGTGLHVTDATTTVVASDVLIARSKKHADGGFGRGVGVVEGASLTLQRASLVEHHDIALFGSDDGTTITASDILLARTQPTSGGTFGRGIHVQFGAMLTLERASVTSNHEAGALFIWSGGSVIDTLLAGTEPSPKHPLGFADGLLVTGSVVETRGVFARGNARAGVLYDRSEGEVSSCFITENAIGLADQGLPGATVAGDNLVTGNGQNLSVDASLAVPDQPMEIPAIPEFN